MSEFGWKYLTAADKRALSQGIRDGGLYGGPYHLEIHPADRCNIECFFCSTAAIRGTDELPQQRFEELIDEAIAAGVRSIRLSGGGEPLFHRRIKPVLRHIATRRLPIENLTTNGVLLDAETAALLVASCDQVTISLNTADPESYASMMKTPARNFERVRRNVRTLADARRAGSPPRITIQYLVWRENFRSIPRMYELARELGADEILFNGLSFLSPEQKMTPEEREELLALYEALVREDEFRLIGNIASYEFDLTPDIDALIHRLANERNERGFGAKAVAFLRRPEPLRDRLRHFLKMRANVRSAAASSEVDDACVIGWYSMVVRSTGDVAPCCILQHRRLGNVMHESLESVWRGEGFATLRQELSAIIRAADSWELNGEERVVDRGCALNGTCPMRSYYYRRDMPFVDSMRS